MRSPIDSNQRLMRRLQSQYRNLLSQEKSRKKQKASWRRLWEATGFGEKKLWDVLELLISASIPVLIFVGGWRLNDTQKQREGYETAQRSQDIALQSYLDQMSQ